MIIGRDYLLKKPPGPSEGKIFLDTKIIPLAVNMAGRVEVALDRVSVRTGLRPAVVLTGLAGLACLVLLGRARRAKV